MPKSKLPTVNVYHVLEQAVTNGVRRGLRRAFKHTDAPNTEDVGERIVEAVMLEMEEWFKMEGE